jgi:hypothetical protein
MLLSLSLCALIRFWTYIYIYIYSTVTYLWEEAFPIQRTFESFSSIHILCSRWSSRANHGRLNSCSIWEKFFSKNDVSLIFLQNICENDTNIYIYIYILIFFNVTVYKYLELHVIIHWNVTSRLNSFQLLMLLICFILKVVLYYISKVGKTSKISCMVDACNIFNDTFVEYIIYICLI